MPEATALELLSKALWTVSRAALLALGLLPYGLAPEAVSDSPSLALLSICSALRLVPAALALGLFTASPNWPALVDLSNSPRSPVLGLSPMEEEEDSDFSGLLCLLCSSLMRCATSWWRGVLLSVTSRNSA